MNNMNIYIHGSLAYDRIMDYPGYFKDSILPDKVHDLSVSFSVDSINVLRGGSGGNVAYNLMLIGEKPYLINGVGKDATEYINFLKQHELPTDHLEIFDDVLTSSATIITDKSNNQITAFNVGSSAKKLSFSFHSVDAKNAIAIFSPASNPEDTMRYIHECKELGIRYIFDPGQTTADFTSEQLVEAIENAEIFTVNDYELELTQKLTGLSEEEIEQSTKVLVVTLGSKGSEMRTDEKIVKVPAAKNTKMKDPTGAGDAYRAGLLRGMAEGIRLKHMGRIAACTASFAIEKIGTQEHTYTMESFRKRYEESFDTKCPI